MAVLFQNLWLTIEGAANERFSCSARAPRPAYQRLWASGLDFEGFDPSERMCILIDQAGIEAVVCVLLSSKKLQGDRSSPKVPLYGCG